MTQYRVFCCLLVLIPRLLVAAFAWDFIAGGKLFYCSDSLGAFDFIPPFVHPRTDNHYIAPVFAVGSLGRTGPFDFGYDSDCDGDGGSVCKGQQRLRYPIQ